MSPTVNPTYSNGNDDKNYLLNDKNYLLTIYHQNIQGLKGKINELTLSLVSDMPHIICLSENHLKNSEIDFVYV
jgi:hypothetical protein